MTRRHYRRKKVTLASGLAIVITILLTQYSPTVRKTVTNSTIGGYKVVKFYDGDTIAVDMNGSEETIRMIGVDTPETHDPRKAVQCYGQAASEYTKQLISSQYVRLESDPINTNRDRYGRLLRYVYLPDGRLVNQQIIENGYGFAYLSFPFTKADDFKASQDRARQNNQGLWKQCTVTGDERPQTNDL